MSNDVKPICYYCGELATSVEHVPPKCFFPEGQREELFTVPSCNIHNNNKSHDDEYVKVMLTTSANVMFKSVLKPVIDKSFRALDRSPGFASAVFKNPEPAAIHFADGRQIMSTSHEIDLDRFYSFFDSLGRALYFHHEKKIWNGGVRIAPHFLLNDTPEEKDLQMHNELIELFDRANSWGKNKSIFYYNFVTVYSDEKIKDIILYVLTVCLFDEFKVSILLVPSQ
ncbi:hypothetical protein FMJ84_15970 [Klebsiella oxytoca]|uniref:hypothetical protein n=1 Tax=Klebsiella oxytoca TaxID=571 RepID=UPI001CCB80A8|nr:hypothetical protein [Klebsiella oxytoca]MBZ6767811.1 hypothetical protein [Klebsiella oxytoca]